LNLIPHRDREKVKSTTALSYSSHRRCNTSSFFGWVTNAPGVHINTEVRVAWRHGLEKGLTGRPNEVVPYKILPFAVEAIKQVVTSRLKLFNGLQ
jgi:hypothetical protein